MLVDYDNHVFTADGKFLDMFGKYGSGRENSKILVGIAIDMCMSASVIIIVFLCSPLRINSCHHLVKRGVAVDDSGVCDGFNCIHLEDQNFSSIG